MSTHLGFGNMKGGGESGTLESYDVGQKDNDYLRQLLDQAKSRQAMLGSEANKPTGVMDTINPDGSKQSVPFNPRTMPAAGLPTGLNAGQLGVNKGIEAQSAAPGQGAAASQIEDLTRDAKVKTAGAEAGARAGAELPYQLRLAQVHADLSLLNQKAIDEYKRAHPHATASELNRQSAAQTALTTIAENREMLEELDKQGLIGPLAGRAADIESGKIKAEDLFADKNQAKLAADYFASMRLLKSLAAVAHGGARGGGSVGMDHIFGQIISGIGDKSIVSGQLDALQRIMEKYANDPNSTPMGPEDIPGMPPKGPSALDKLRSRSSGIPMMAPVPSHGGRQ
jgi:hypothetical protein